MTGPGPPGTSRLAVAALVCSLAGLICCGLPSIVGLGLGLAAMRETKRTGRHGYGLAVAAVIISALLVLLGLGYLAYSTLVDAGSRRWAP